MIIGNWGGINYKSLINQECRWLECVWFLYEYLETHIELTEVLNSYALIVGMSIASS